MVEKQKLKKLQKNFMLLQQKLKSYLAVIGNEE